MGNTKRKVVMKTSISRIWFDVGPSGTLVPKGLKFSALTMRKSSPFYDADTWVDRDGFEQTMTAYTCLPDDFQKGMEKETGLDIAEYDTCYILQVFVNFRRHPTENQLREARFKLSQFVGRHFKPFVPKIKANG